MLLAAAIFASINVYGQGTINFGNNSFLKVTNTVDNKAVAKGTASGTSATDTFLAQLWFHPDGPKPESSAMQPIAGTAGISPIAGVITGGEKTVPNTPGGTAVWFQMRVWEKAYGETWDEAQNHAPINGRLAIVGESNIFRLATGAVTVPPSPAPLLTQAGGLGLFTVSPIIPEPSIIGLGLLGAGSLLFLRRRK